MNASQRRVMRTRLGQTGYQGSRPWAPWSKILVTKTAGVGEAPGTLCGFHCPVPINNWNDPMGTLGDLVAGTGQKIQDRHPIHHNDAIADGYDLVQVLSCKLKFELMWNIAEDVTSSRMTWGYAFSGSITSPFNHATGSAATGELLNMVSDPRWTTGEFIADPNRRAVVVRVNVPSCLTYGKIFHAGLPGSGLEAFGAGNMAHTLADSPSSSNNPNVPIWIHFVLFNNTGLETIVSSVKMRIESVQKVRIMRTLITADLDQSPDIHA